MPVCVAMMISSSARSPPAIAPLRSPLSSEAKGSFCFHSGCCGASAFTRSSTKYNWTGSGFSHHSVPSLSKVAMRSGTGTKSGEPGLVTFSTKVMMDCLAGPSFHEGNGSSAFAEASADRAVRPLVAVKANATLNAMAKRCWLRMVFIAFSLQ
jgi:hypothetical protein